MADAARRGYDFGYLLKILTNAPLPSVEADFFNTLHLWFPHVYDIKHIMRSVRNLKGGLQEISDSMGVSLLIGDDMLSLTSRRLRE
jgi:CCR4-NOT transcription complex subunit 7/8